MNFSVLFVDFNNSLEIFSISVSPFLSLLAINLASSLFLVKNEKPSFINISYKRENKNTEMNYLYLKWYK